eukprot:33212-Eustigmatos_ZCMA.PRE.1
MVFSRTRSACSACQYGSCLNCSASALTAGMRAKLTQGPGSRTAVIVCTSVFMIRAQHVLTEGTRHHLSMSGEDGSRAQLQTYREPY